MLQSAICDGWLDRFFVTVLSGSFSLGLATFLNSFLPIPSVFQTALLAGSIALPLILGVFKILTACLLSPKRVQVIAPLDRQKEKAIERENFSFTYTEFPMPWNRQPLRDLGAKVPDKNNTYLDPRFEETILFS